MSHRRRFAPSVDGLESRRPCDSAAYADITPWSADITAWTQGSSASGDWSGLPDVPSSAMPDGGGAFVPYDVPPEIAGTTDPTGYAAGVAGSSWTGDARYEPTRVEVSSAFD
jgi:hypothetical protein